MWKVSDEALIDIYLNAMKTDLPEEFIALVRAEIERRSLEIPSVPSPVKK